MEEKILLLLGVIGFLACLQTLSMESTKCKFCKKIIKSKYSKLLWIDLSTLGIIYYSFISIISLSNIFFANLAANMTIHWIRIIISGLAALLSIYLTFIQIKLIKQTCLYCLISAMISIAIFLLLIF